MKLPLPRVIAQASPRRRLWLGAGAAALFLGTLFAAAAVRPHGAGSGRTLAVDYIAFYTAGHFVDAGRPDLLYDLNATQRYQRQMLLGYGEDIGSACGPWWNPPFYALLFVPMARLPYPTALYGWMGLNLLCAGVAGVLLVRMLPKGAGWRSWALLPVFTGLSMPFIHAVSHAQNTGTSLLILTIAVTLWRKRRGIVAGLVGGLMFYKPQLGAVLAGVMILDLGVPAAAGFATTGLLLLAVNLVALPGTIGAYVHQMPANLHHVQTQTPYVWYRHVTFAAFWRSLIQGTGVGETLGWVKVLGAICSGSVAMLLLRAIWRSRGGTGSSADLRCDRLIAATITATPLLMPFYFDYDQLLLAIPAALLVAEWMRSAGPMSRADRRLIAIAVVYYPWLMINPDVTARTGFNGAVVLLAGIVVCMTGRLASSVDSGERVESTAPREPALARAA